MRKAAAYLAMAGIVAVLLGADVLLLTSGESLSRLAGEKLQEKLGEVLRWRECRATRDGTVTLEEVDVIGAPLRAERVEIRMKGGLGGPVDAVVFEGLRLAVDDALFEDLAREKPAGRTIRDVIPDPSELPKILCRSGTVSVALRKVVAKGAPLTLEVSALVASPVDGYRIHLEGNLDHPLLGSWRAEGEVDLETGAHDLRIRSKDLVIRPEIRDLLAPEPARIYDKYLPGGRCDLSVRVAEGNFRVTLVARDMQLTYRNFPYAVEKMRGEIDFFAKGFRVKHMTARHGPAVIRFDGAADGYPATSGFDFRLEVDDAPLDAELRAALDEGGRKVWDLFDPKGRVAIRGRVWRRPGPDDPDHIPLEIYFKETSMRYKGFPYPLDDVSGNVFVDGNDVVVRRLQARDGEALLEVTGTIGNITGEADIDLSVDARRLQLDGRLRAALPPEIRKTWDRFSPGGPVDVRWNVRMKPGGEPVHRGRVRALGNRVRFVDLPLPATDVTGEIEVVPGAIRLRHLSAKAHGARIQLHGTVGDGAVTLEEVDVVGLRLDEPLKKALPEGVRKLIRQLRLSGMVNFTSSLTLRDDGDNDFTLNLNLTRGTIETEPRFEDLLGNVTLTGTFGKETRLMGPLTFSHVKVWGKQLSDVSASLVVNGPRITFGNIKATAYGGVIGGNLSVDTETGRIDGGKITIDRLDIRDYARDTQGYTSKTLSGKVSLDLPELTGNTGDAATLRGRGRLTVQDAALWDVPLFGSLFSLNFQDLFKQKNKFDAGAVVFRIEDRRFVVESLAFRSESINVVGKGTVGFDGRLNLILRPKAERFLGIDFFLLKWITEPLGWLKDAFHGVHVTGTFDEPKMGQEFFPADETE